MALFFVASCTPVAPTKTSAEPEKPVKISSIAVLPPETPIDQKQKNDQSANRIKTGRAVLTRLLAEYFHDMGNVQLISQSEQEGVPIDITGSREALARKMGKELGNDAVMTSTIIRYVPFNASESQLASAAFDYRLIAVDTGQVLCSGSFNETQQVLSDNILSLRKAFSRKFKWLTAEELLREGLHDKLDKCFYLRRPPKTAP